MKKSDRQIMEIQEAFNATGVAHSPVLLRQAARARQAERARRAKENAAYVRELLGDRQPEFLAALRSAERQVDFELSREKRERRGAGSQAGARSTVHSTQLNTRPGRDGWYSRTRVALKRDQ